MVKDEAKDVDHKTLSKISGRSQTISNSQTALLRILGACEPYREPEKKVQLVSNGLDYKLILMKPETF